MPSRYAVAVFVLLVSASQVHAHAVGAPPNTCVFDPIELSTPLGAAAVASPASTDAVQITYDVDASTVQLTSADAEPRSFTIGSLTGTVAIQGVVQATISSAGDLYAADVSIVVTVDGTAVAVPIDLTTSLAAADGVIAEGKPIGSDSVVVLAGTIPTGALPGPLVAGPTTLRLHCVLLPQAPDIDQFEPTATVTSLRGAIASDKMRLRFVLRGGDRDPLEVQGVPVALRLTADGAKLLDVVSLDGLVAQEKAFVGVSSDGLTSITVKPSRGQGKPTFRVDVSGTTPSTLASRAGKVSVGATWAVGERTARGARTFKASPAGLKRR